MTKFHLKTQWNACSKRTSVTSPVKPEHTEPDTPRNSLENDEMIIPGARSIKMAQGKKLSPCNTTQTEGVYMAYCGTQQEENLEIV